MAKKKIPVAVTELVVAPKKNIKVIQEDPNANSETFAKSILNELNAGGTSIHRLAFEADPLLNNIYSGVYKQRLRLLPPYVIKRIAIQDDLVASILQCRQNHLSAFGWPRQNRFENGFVIEPKQAALEAIEKEPTEIKETKKEELHRRIAAATKVILNCGYTDGIPENDRLTFSQYLSQSTRNALLMGMLATEILWRDLPNGNKKFHAFRVIDAGTVYKAAPHSRSLENVRASALAALEKIKNERLKPEKFESGEYAWVQVIDGRPVQAFTAQECLVHMFYAVPDVEMDGYPVTPLDTAISAVTTHINITTHNKLYFQYGRASHGMLVLKSEDADERVLRNMKQVFNASVNSAANSFRMPVFAIGPEDDLRWSPIDTQGKDAEFQYLIDMNARVILSAFMIGPEEIPGWSYLSKGTNSQALSEAAGEYKLTAARDVGLRPLIRCFEEFLNTSLFPLIDPVLAEMATIRLVGLEAETAEKEAVRLQQDMQVHLTMDQILEKVEKRPVGKDWGGEFFFNPAYQSILDRYFTVGQIKEYWFGHKGAAQDPKYDYFRDSFFMQYQQLLMGQQQLEAEAQTVQVQDPGSSQGQPDDALRNKVDEALNALKKSGHLPEKLTLLTKGRK